MSGLFDKAKCFVGVHDWGEWKYKAPGTCHQLRICKRSGCTEKEIREEQHVWGIWAYEAEHSCQEIRTCTRCDKKEKREKEHIWGIWDYEAEHSCQEIRTCTRCDKKEKREKEHVWDEWTYVAQDPWQQYITQLRKIRNVLATRFDMGGVKAICVGIGIDIENLPGETKSDKARELVKELELHHRLDELVQFSKKERPDIYWDEMEISGKTVGDLEENRKKFSIDQLSWEFDPSESCNQARKCSRCEEIERRNQHRWSDKVEYEYPSSCEVARFCKRCGEKKSEGLKHQWGEWGESTTECKEVRTCRKCREREIGKIIPHKWSDWSISLTDCKQTRSCLRCGQPDVPKESVHNWGKWDFETPVSCVLVRACIRCGKTEKDVESKPHQWGEWNYESPVSCQIVRKCARCGESENNKEIKHKWTEWSDETADSCKIMRTCQRCDIRETSEAKHKWADWETIAPSTPFRRSCKKCGQFEMSVAGIWTGLMKIEKDYFCDLYLEEVENSVKGVLVLAYYNPVILTIVRQPVEGKIDGKEIDLSGTSYSFVKKGVSKSYNLDRIVGEISSSGDKINGKVPSSSSSGTIELSFARPELCSQLNVSGLWDGMVRWNAGQEDRWDLFLEKGGSILKGILIVTVIQDEKVVSVVEQQVIGELSNQEITFKGTSGKFIYESGSKYSLDSFSGLIMDSGGTIKGDVISGNSTGTVTLTMARTK